MNEIVQSEAFLNEIQKYGSTLGLENMKNLMHELAEVQNELRIIHVAGTNGKGSVCAMLSSVLAAASYRVGTYTSPAVFQREEQYLINMQPASKKKLAAVFCQIEQACMNMTRKGKRHPTLFEVETAAAFLFFYQEKCDIVILETGLGGVSDATNIITEPLCCVFTSISMDHMSFLGHTLEEIAQAKAGIMKAGRPVVSVVQKKEAAAVLQAEARKKNCPLLVCVEEAAVNIRSEQPFLVFDYKDQMAITLSLTGIYQIENSVCVLETVAMINKQGFCVDAAALHAGLRNTVWPGRYEQISQQPLVLIDGAHNEAAGKRLYDSLLFDFPQKEKIFIIGVLKDKEYEKLLKQLLPLAQKVYTVTPKHIRALDGRELCRTAQKYHSDVAYCKNIESAVQYAMKDVSFLNINQGMVIAFGSLSYLKEIKNTVQSGSYYV